VWAGRYVVERKTAGKGRGGDGMNNIFYIVGVVVVVAVILSYFGLR
jgi:hypothetical protein